MIIPVDYDWHLLVADATGLPAISRRLEELPATAAAMVIGQAEPGDRRSFDTAARVQVQWTADAEAMIEAVRAWSPAAGAGFVWCAGEAAAMGRLREILVQEKGLQIEAMRVAAYWKRGASSYHVNLE